MVAPFALIFLARHLYDNATGFNYAYRRSATPVTAATPSSVASPLPAANTKPNGNDKPLPPHLNNRASTATPPIAAKDSPKDTPPRVGGASPAPNAGIDKAEKERQKRKEKKDRKDKERAEREANGKEGDGDTSLTSPLEVQLPKSGKGTPVPDASTSGPAADFDTGLKSPTADSTGGARTPTGKGGKKNPWTIFMRMGVQVTEPELREFFNDAKDGIIKINLPPAFAGRAKIAYVEFGDEEAMRAGLEKHAEVFIFATSLLVSKC